jgi:hypothetical protein
MAFFVQFPHPGVEHKPPANGRDKPWNVGDHARKFLISRGWYVDSEPEPRDDELFFWGEWEPPSRVERRWHKSDRLPEALHRPYWMLPASTSFRQNTDPWVFGPTMHYSNCRQTASMQRLTAGSIICFGSTIGGDFCVDTVFVVASSEPWTPAQAARVKAEQAFITCTAESLATSPRDANRRYMLYRGASLDHPVHGMFSFVPARLANSASVRFTRPVITLPGLINPASKQSPRGVNDPLSLDRVRVAWSQIREQVLAQNLVMAVRFDSPEKTSGTAPIPITARARC